MNGLCEALRAPRVQVSLHLEGVGIWICLSAAPLTHRSAALCPLPPTPGSQDRLREGRDRLGDCGSSPRGTGLAKARGRGRGRMNS